MSDTFTINRNNIQELIYWASMADFSAINEYQFAMLTLMNDALNIHIITSNETHFYQRINIIAYRDELLPSSLKVEAKSLHALLKKIESSDNWWSNNDCCTISMEIKEDTLFWHFTSINSLYHKALRLYLIPENDIPEINEISLHTNSVRINKTDLEQICMKAREIITSFSNFNCANIMVANGVLTITSLHNEEIKQKTVKINSQSRCEMNINSKTIHRLIQLLGNANGDVDVLSLADSINIQTNKGAITEILPATVNTLVEKYKKKNERIISFVLSKKEVHAALDVINIAELRNSNSRLFLYFTRTKEFYLLTDNTAVNNDAKLTIINSTPKLGRIKLISVNLKEFTKKYRKSMLMDNIIVHLVLSKSKKIKPTLKIYNSTLINIPEVECIFEIENTEEHLDMIERSTFVKGPPTAEEQDDLFGIL